MAILSCTDQRPVYLNSNGLPLASGRLTFKAIGTTNLLTVYSDLARTIPAPNPNYLDASGRTETQLFYQDAQYDVYADQFNGTDPLTAPPEDWSEDHDWVVDGSLANAAASGYATVDTIAALRTTDPLLTPLVSVLGYYTKGDLYIRNYMWTLDVLPLDNGGTIITHTGDASGRWILQDSNPVIDVRVFGIIPGLSYQYNSALQSLATYTAGLTNSSTTIFFPSGMYHVTNGALTFDVPVKHAQGVTFRLDSSGEYVVFYTRGLDAPATGLTAAGSLGMLTPKFTLEYADPEQPKGLNQEVWPRWWSVYGSYVGNSAWSTMLANITTEHTIVVDNQIGGHLAWGTQPLDLNHNIRFERGAYLTYSSVVQGTAKVTFMQGCKIIKDDGYGCFNPSLSGFFGNFVLGGMQTLKTSCFLPMQGEIQSTNTHDLGKILTALQSASTEYCTIVYDAPISEFTTEYYDSGDLKHTLLTGTVVAPAIGGDEVSFVNLSNQYRGGLSGAIVIRKGVTHFDAFAPGEGEDTSYAYRCASNCALRGNGVLDLDGHSIEPTNTYGINPGAGGANPRFTIRNGTLSASTPHFLVNINGGLFSHIALENLYINNGSSGTVINLDCVSYDFTIRNCEVNSNGTLLTAPISAQVVNVSIINSQISGYDISDAAIPLKFLTTGSTFYMKGNNMGFGGYSRLTSAGCTFDNPQNTVATVSVGGYGPSTIGTSNFLGCMLYLYSDRTDHTWADVVSSSVFHSTGDNQGYGVTFADQAPSPGSTFKGAAVTGSSFKCSWAILSEAVTTSSSWMLPGSGASNYLQVSGNTEYNSNPAVTRLRQTEGVVRVSGVAALGGQIVFDLTDSENFNRTSLLYIESTAPYLLVTGGTVYLTTDPQSIGIISAALYNPTGLGVYVVNTNYTSLTPGTRVNLIMNVKLYAGV